MASVDGDGREGVAAAGGGGQGAVDLRPEGRWGREAEGYPLCKRKTGIEKESESSRAVTINVPPYPSPILLVGAPLL